MDKVTATCCLDCVAKPCPVGYNCRDNKPPEWCKSGKAKGECYGNCEYFKLKGEKS